MVLSFHENKLIHVFIAFALEQNASSNQIKLQSHICHLGVCVGRSHKYLPSTEHSVRTSHGAGSEGVSEEGLFIRLSS